MAPVGRPRTRTGQGIAAPTTELGVPDLGMGGYSGGVAGMQPMVSGSGPWRMYVDEWEFVPELRWPWSVRLFDQMRTDSQLAGLLTAVMWGICQLRFVIDPNGANPTLVEEVSEDLNLPILGDEPAPRGRMKHRFSHSRFIVQAMLSAIYGHTFFEQVGTIVDGKWRLRKLAPRMPQTIRQINVADDGGLVSIVQHTPAGWYLNGKLNYGPEIPVDRLTAFVFQQEGMSWTGRSMMRDCYRDWIIKDRNLRVEAVNHERAGGIPWAEGAVGMTDDELHDLDQMMQRFRIGDNSGGAVPAGTKVNVAKGTGSDVDATIKRLDESMARRFLLMLVNLAQGGQHVGSYALGETFEDFFIVGQRHIAQWYCDTMTEHVIEDIVDWNYGEDEELAPRITWERTTEDSLGVENLAQLVQRGVVTMDQDLENWVRYKFFLPKKTEPRPEVSPGGPKQPNEQQSQNPATGGAGTSTTQAAGPEERVLPPPHGPAPVQASWRDWFKRKPDIMASSAPVLVTVPNVPILHAGIEYQLSTGPATFTPEDLRDAVTAANEDPSIPSPRLGIGHVDPQYNDWSTYDGTPNWGLAKNLRLSDNGMAVYADYVGVPKWLGDILPYAFPSRSIEGWQNVDSQHGKKWRFILSACKLLGVRWPGVTVLEDLPMFYGSEVPTGVEFDDQIVEAARVAATQPGGDPMKWPFGRTSASANLDDIRRAFYQAYVPDHKEANWWWIQQVLVDPNEIVIEDDESGQLYKLSFATGADGTVTFGEPNPVRIDYVPDNKPETLKAAAVHIAAAMAVGRNVMASWNTREDSVLPATATGGAMDPKAIRQRLGLPEDASDEQVQTTLREINEALTAGQTPPAPTGQQPAPPAPATPPPPSTPPPTEQPGGQPAPSPAPTTPGTTPQTPPPTPPAQPEELTRLAASLPAGVVLMDETTLNELRSNGAAAASLVKQNEKNTREGLVSAAIADGRVAPARKEHWLQALEADPGAAETLAALKPGLVPVDERGHGAAPENNGAAIDDDTVAGWTQQLFRETRPYYQGQAAAAAGQPAPQPRVQKDANYARR